MKRKLHFTRKFFALLLSTILIVGLIGTGIVFKYMKGMIDTRPALNIDKLKTPESTLVYDSQGNLISELSAKYSDNISYHEIPNSVIDAFISVEDAKFFEHEGFDVSRFIMSAITGLPKMLRGDGFGAGASTITMQTIKNGIFATDESLAEVSLERKVQEISLSLDLEKEISKEEIFTLYLNRINYGAPNSRGIQKAAEYYFGKTVSELSLSESAYLAGVINGPSLYNAYYNIKPATERRNLVLDLMVRHGYLTKSEAEIAKSVPLENQLVGSDKFISAGNKYQEYIDVVIDELYNKYNLDPYFDGLKVYTALIPSQQDLIESIEHSDYYYDSKVDTAFVTLNNQTGELVAIGGGRFFDGQEKPVRGFNNATSLYRQPGSSLKPILPYALGFEYLGYSSKHVIEDGPYAYPYTDIFVNNFSRTYRGDTLIEDAVSFSLNIPALKTFDEVVNNVGREVVVDYLKNIGLTKNADSASSIYAIGGGEFEATPVQVAAAHATMMNEGEYIEPHTVTKIVKENEEIIANPRKTQVLSKGAAYLTTNLLYATVNRNRGYGTSAHLLPNYYPLYAKSGTSDFGNEFEQYGIPSGATKDGWLVASTSNFTNLSWTGYTKFVNEDGTGNYIGDLTFLNQQNAYNVTLLLDGMLNYHEPQYIQRPDDVSQMTHVIGVYPYVAPKQGMNSKYIVNAEILSKFATLGELNVRNQTIEDMRNQAIKIGKLSTKGLELSVTVDKYPTESDGSAVKTMSWTSSSGITQTATGTKLFDPSWVFGTIQYVTEIKADGQVIHKETTGGAEKSFTIPNVKSNQNLEVCSYYAYESSGLKSNVLCETINAGKLQADIPSGVGTNLSQTRNWLNENGFTNVVTNYDFPTSTNQIGQLKSMSPTITEIENNFSAYQNSQITLTVYDAVVNNLNGYIGRTVKELLAANPYPGVLTFTGDVNDQNDIITSLTGNGSVLPASFRLTEISTVTVTAD